MKFIKRKLLPRDIKKVCVKVFQYKDCTVRIYNNRSFYFRYEYVLIFDKLIKTLMPKRLRAIKFYSKDRLTVYDRTSHRSLLSCKETAKENVNEILSFASSPRLRMVNW